MKIISYGVWGDNPFYTVGAIKNADLARILFPDWMCVFYCFESVPNEIVKELQSKQNCIVRLAPGVGDRRSALQRFFPAEEEGVEYFLSRDTDSRLSPREVMAVNEWISEGTDVHIIRDHPYHSVPLLAGMWGVRGGKLKGIQKHAEEYVSKTDPNHKFQDQDFLTSWVWSKIQNGQLTLTTHDPIFSHKPFPRGASRGETNDGVWFVGQCFESDGKYNSQSDVDVVLNYEQNMHRWETV